MPTFDDGDSLGYIRGLLNDGLTKLDGIESGATADQTGADIKALYEAEPDTNAFTDAEKSKLSGVESGATADQTGAEIKSAYEAEPDTNAFTDSDKSNLDSTVATVNGLTAQGVDLYAAYATRAGFVAAVSGGLSVPDGGIVAADGIFYAVSSGATAISDLPGWLPADQWPADARHFGAAFDGTTDDTAELQAGIDYVNSLAGGGILELPGGTAIVSAAIGSNSLELKSNVWLRGRGRSTILKLGDSANAHVINVGTGTSGQSVTDLKIDGNRANQLTSGGTHGIRVNSDGALRVERVFITEARYYGIGIGTRINDSRFIDIEISNCGRPSDNQGDGFDVKSSVRCVFQNIYVHDCEQRGLDVRGEQNIYDNIWCYDNGSTGISFRALNVGVNPASEENYIKATNCYSFNNGAEGYIITSNESPVTGFKCEFDLVNCHAFNNGTAGFDHQGTEIQTRYTNCTAKENGTNGFRGNSTGSDTTNIAIYTACHAVDNTSQGFFVPTGLGRHSFSQCSAKGNGSNDQVFFQSNNIEWAHCHVDNSGGIRGLYCTGNNFTAIGGSVNSDGSNDGLRVDGTAATIIGMRFTQAQNRSCIRLTGADAKVIGCDFTEVTNGPRINNSSATDATVLGNQGITDPIQTSYDFNDINGLTIHPSGSNQPVQLETTGLNTSIDLALVPKGAGGRVRFGTHAAIGSQTVTGYIEVKDSSGTLRRLAVVS